MTKPLITIGITCFREGDWLLECWQSVLTQSDARWLAVLVMDGGADERTQEIFGSFDHPKLRKHAMGMNAGPAIARNRAFELTETPYHFYLDGDDQLMPNSVASVLRCFERYPTPAVVYGDYQCFGNVDEIWRYPRTVTVENLLEDQPVPGPCAYSVAGWKQLGGFARELARGNYDYDFCIGAFEAGLISLHCGDIIYRYRLSSGPRVSGSYRLTYHKTHEIIVRRHPQFFRVSARRNRFLALGYKRAAVANVNAGNKQDGIRLTWKAIQRGLWRDPILLEIVLNRGYFRWAYFSLRYIVRVARRLRRPR